MKKKIVIFGAGQQGRICKRLATVTGYKVIAFIDDYEGKTEGIPVYRRVELIPHFEKYKYIVAVGDIKVRKKFIQVINKYRLKCVNLIDPTADIEKGAIIGTGNFIYKFASIYESATIGDHNIINCKAVVAADAVVSNNCNICMGANLCGDVHVGENTYVGYQATVVSGNNVGKNSYVEAGSVVKNNIPDNTKVEGIPAK